MDWKRVFLSGKLKLCQCTFEILKLGLATPYNYDLLDKCNPQLIKPTSKL